MNGIRAGTVQEGYARLPEDLLHDLLGGADELVTEVERLLGSSLDNQEELREALESSGLVRQLRERSQGTLSGVDGGFAIERTSSVDISLAVAVGVEGLSEHTTQWGGTQYEWWSRVGKHDLESERLCRGIMTALELEILQNAPHDFRILDGSHLTPIIQLNSALTVRSEELLDEAARRWGRSDTRSGLAQMAEDVHIIAMPKYDSSRAIVEGVLQSRVDFDIPGDDKLLMSLLLRPNEFIDPQRVNQDPWRQLHFDARAPRHQEIARAFEEAIEPLQNQELNYLYFKPDELSPAFRIETKRAASIELIEQFLTSLKYQMTGPFVREPYPQYLADIMAKSVGLGLSALQSSVQLALSRADRPELAELLLTSYRTEGV